MELLTIGKAAKKLGIHPNSLRNWKKRGGYNANSNLMYSSTPVYIPIPGVKSYTNPVVAGNVMYQHCYDVQGYGYLYAFDASRKPPTDQYGNPTQQIWHAPQVWPNPVKFPCRVDMLTWIAAISQDLEVAVPYQYQFGATS